MNGKAWLRAWSRSSAAWERLSPRIAAATGWRIWNPGSYGAPWHRLFREIYPLGERPVLMFGLNPGPYGMGQTGIPFTDVRRLRQCLPKMALALQQRSRVPRVPGLAPRSLRRFLTREFESSAVRVYRFLELGWGSAEEGWLRVGVANSCPLLFLDSAGGNRTPAVLGAAIRRKLGAGDSAARLCRAIETQRVKSALEAIAAARPRGAVLLGKDVQGCLGDRIRERMGERGVLFWRHPARAVPEEWARGLLEAIGDRGWYK